MNFSNSPVGAQGAAADQNTFARTFDSALRIFGFVVLFANLFLLGSSLFGQSYDTLDASQCNFQIIAPYGTLNQGETATFYIKIGTETAQITDMVGFDIDLSLGSHAVIPSDPQFGIGESWFFSPSVADTQEAVDGDAGTVTLTGARTDTETPTGYGDLFAITLECNGNGISAASLITTGGGKITVDDLGYKTLTRAEVTQPEPVLYPNPCRGQLNMNWNGEQPSAMYLVNQQGQPVFVSTTAIEMGTFDVSGLAPGLYHVVMNYPSGRVSRTVVIS